MSNTPLYLRVQILRLVLLAGLLGSCVQVFAQGGGGQRPGQGQGMGGESRPRNRSSIIDDSTRQVYGPHTSFTVREEDYFFNRRIRATIDTAIRDFHRYNYVQRNNNLYQDLGNIGTAIRPIFTQAPALIGATPGFDAYNLYWDREQVKYYDTRSPYSNMNVVVGGKGRSITRITYSRNINPRWNFGFNYRGLFIDKQIQRSGKGDRNVKSTYYDFFTSYESKDSSYSLFFNFRRSFLQADEYGGVQTSNPLTFDQFFSVNARPWLTEAESNDLRSTVHLYQQYRLGSGFQVYHVGDWYRQRNQFKDTPASEPDNYYDAVVVDSTLTRDQTMFHSFRNEVGVKGNLLKLFYNYYAAVRSYSMDYKYFYESSLPVKTSGNELYVGGRMELALDSLVTVKGQVEWLFTNRYRIEGSIKTKWFDAGLRRVKSRPSFVQQAYRGSHDIWVNDFDDVETNELWGSIHYTSRRFSVSPGLHFTTIRNFIFFQQGVFNSDQTVLPVQASGYNTYTSPELQVSLVPVKNITWKAQAVYTRMLENSNDALQMPEWFINTQLAYANIWYHGNFDFQVGVDVHYKSAYHAYGYDPVIQQFYTQQSFQVPAVPVIDLFLNAKILRGRIFLKYNNLFKTFNKYAAIPTPYYPGIRNLVDFGFDWSFYD